MVKETPYRGVYPPHEAIGITAGGQSIRVDRGMEAVVSLLNESGIRTTGCCRGDDDPGSYPGKLGDWAYVSVAEDKAAIRLVHLLLDDCIDYPTHWAEMVSVDGRDGGITIRWPSRHTERIEGRLKRVLASSSSAEQSADNRQVVGPTPISPTKG